jgi:hypothetical protein
MQVKVQSIIDAAYFIPQSMNNKNKTLNHKKVTLPKPSDLFLISLKFLQDK